MTDLSKLRAGDAYTVQPTGEYRLGRKKNGEIVLMQQLIRLDNGFTEWHERPTMEIDNA